LSKEDADFAGRRGLFSARGKGDQGGGDQCGEENVFHRVMIVLD
jgi:hypothetical protein